MATVDSKALVTPSALDPISLLLQQLIQPAKRSTEVKTGGTTTETTVNNADTTALRSLLAQLQTGSTPAGAADIINQIFAQGTQAALPEINQRAAATGARAGTSTYRALAVNDLSARLAGQAAVELNRNVQVATQAAANLAQATQAPTKTAVTTPSIAARTDSNKFGAESILAPLAIGAGKTVLANMLNTPKTVANKTVSKSAVEFFGPDVTSAINLDPGNILGARNQGGSMTDFIINNAVTAGQGADAATTAVVATPDISPSTGSSGATGLVFDFGFNELFGGGNNADTLGASAVSALFPGAGLAQAAGEILGVKEVGNIMEPVNAVAGDVVQGAGDVVDTSVSIVEDIGQSISKAVSTVVCTELHRRGILPTHLYSAYAQRISSINPLVMRGYHAWAKPVVRAMQHDRWYSEVLIVLAKPFVFGRALQITGQPNLFGGATTYIGEPVCWTIGAVGKCFDYIKGVR